MKHIFFLGLALSLADGGQAVAQSAADPAQISTLLDSMRQSGALVKWQEVPWLLDLKEGMRQSREEKRPLLLWVSGDDPLERC